MKPTPKLKQAVAEYRAGKQEAFTTLYEESSKYMYVCIRGIVGGNDNADDIISDIMQDTYVEISRSIGQLRDEDTFLTWAGKIATNKCYRWLAKNKREVLLNEEDTAFENLADSDNIIPEEIFQSLEKQRLVRRIINTQLTEMQKLCIVAYYYNEQKQSEIAQELGIPENTVKTNLSRAKAKIKEGVLDIEKKQGTKLYSIAPLMVFLLGREVSACTVPQSVTLKVSTAVSSTAKGIGKKTLWGKLASASTKTKVVAGIVASTATIATGCVLGTVAYMVTQDNKEAWEKEFRDILLNSNRAVGFDLNDFEEDGIPELVILNEDDSLSVRYCQEYDAGTVYELDAVAQTDEEIGFQNQYNYGYDMEYDRIVELTDWIHKSGQTAKSFNYLHFSDGVMEFENPVSYAFNVDQYPIRWSYSLNENGQESDISEEEAMEYLAEAQSRFNEIRFTNITEDEIEIRFNEFKRNGNRKRKRNDTVTKPVRTESEIVETIETQEAPAGGYNSTDNRRGAKK